VKSRIVTILFLSFATNLVAAAGPDNLLANPHFDDNVSDWQPYGTTPGWTSDDADGLDYSGSMELHVGGDIPLGASQCVSAGTTDEMQVSMDARKSEGTVSSFATVMVVWYSKPLCPNEFTISSPSNSGAIGSDWQRLTYVPARPPSAVSARVFFGAGTTSSAATVHIDNTYFGVPKLFSDRFEIRSGP